MTERVFKNSTGIYLTKQLFFETATLEDKPFVLYTLKDEDHKGFPSIRRLYLLEDDETEYSVATKYFAGWPHWKKLLDTPWFFDYVLSFREELSARQAYNNLKLLRESASSGNTSSAKFLLDKDKKEKPGRPSKQKIRQEAEALFRTSSDISDDLSRIQRGLN